MENKKISFEMYNSKDEKVGVIFELKPMRNRWKFTEIVSESKARTGNDEFKLAFELAKKLFPEMVASPKFELTKKISDELTIGIEEQIKEYFVNDPAKLSLVVANIMGFMTRD